MKLDGKLLVRYRVERGVKQGLMLSPALFLLVMDPLLRQLQASGVGFTVNNLYAGGFSMQMTLAHWLLVKHRCIGKLS